MVGWRKVLAVVAAFTTLSVSNPATAATLILSGGGGGGTVGNSRTFTDGTTTVRATAWSVNLSGIMRRAALGQWAQGLGVRSGLLDSHTVDNVGRREFILFQFDRNVALHNATFNTGWHGMNDTDATIGFGNLALAYTVSPAFHNASVATLLGDFAFHVSGSVGASGNSTRNINPSNFIGNTWIIGAAVPNPDRHADGFKLASLSFTPVAPIPEPEVWALMILGFGLAGAALRHGKAKRRAALA